MNIAQRLALLVAVPLLVLTGLAIFVHLQLATIDARGRDLAGIQVPTLAIIGNVTRSYGELRVDARDYILATAPDQRDALAAHFQTTAAKMDEWFDQYTRTLIVEEQDRQLLENYRRLAKEWTTGARAAMRLADRGQPTEGIAQLGGEMRAVADQLRRASEDWIRHNEGVADEAGAAMIAVTAAVRTRLWIAATLALLVAAGLGFLTFRRIATPIQSLEASVRTIAAGDYEKPVPYVEATDETGSLARSVEVLKHGAAQTQVQARRLEQQAEEMRRANLLSDTALDLTKANYWHLSFDEPEWYYSSERGARLLGQEPVPNFRYRLDAWAQQIRLGDAAAAEATLAAFDAMVAGRTQHYNTTYAFKRPLDGRVIWLKSSGHVVRAPDGRPKEIFGVNQDITEAHLAELAIKEGERQLRETEQFFRGVLERAPDGLMVVDADGTMRLVNEQCEKLFGYARDELIGQKVEMLVPAAIRGHHPGLREGYHQAPTTRTMGAKHELHGQRKDGTLFPVDIGLSPLPARGGAGTQVAVSIRDVTARRKAEKELQSRATELQLINFKADTSLDLTKAGYWHVPLDGTGWYNSSERAARIFGDVPNPDFRYRVDEWARHVEEGDPAAAKVTLENFNAAVAGTVPAYDTSYAYKRPIDGRIVWIHALGHVVKDASGKPTDMYGVTQDITEFKRLERELIAAKEKAEEATQLKSMFLANMSHEIRTPMNAIIGLSHLALKTQLTPKQRDYVSKVHNAGTSLLAIINDILDFSKIEAGKIELETTDFKLDDVIGAVTTVTSQKANDKGLEYLAHVAPGLPPVLRGDPLRLGQILTNLVNNAVKFTERGEVAVQVQLAERTGEKCQLRFSVRDTGAGMTKEQAARLFQPFTQADMSTTRKHGGTGLGLTISRRLVELMGGQISLESAPGQGTISTFTAWFGIGTQKGSGRVVPEKITRLRALIVDDNAAAREIMEDLLQGVVAKTESVASAAEAISAVKQRDLHSPYDVVLMDWRMPDMDGLQASKAIKADAGLKHPPTIVMVTAFGREEVRDEAERLQLDGFLVKPVTKSMVIDALVSIYVDSADQAAAVSSAAEAGVDLTGLRVLLAEDNEINQQIAVELLEGVGANVTVANHGRKAVEKVMHDPQAFDVILMDLQMPELDGYQAVGLIRADPRLTALPIVAMTAHATIEERQRCLAAGMNDHLTKPIDPEVLFQTLARYHQPSVTARAAERMSRAPFKIEIPSVPGIDTADGLGRVSGNRKLYLKLLRDFAESQAAAANVAAEALARGDATTAERLAHTLKGVAGNIGAKPVHAAAGELERRIRERAGAAEVNAALATLRSTLDPVVNALRAGLTDDGPPGRDVVPAAPVDAAQTAALVAQLAKLLEEFDAAAVVFIDENAAALRPAFPPGTWDRFAQHARNFAFAEAQAVLEAARGKRA